MATFSQYRDELKTCPYNPLHKVSTRRYQMHIVRCAKNPANPDLKDCPFNALHKVAAKDLERHILNCKDSRPIIREIEETRNMSSSDMSSSAVVNRSVAPPSLENWDEDVDQTNAKNYVIPGLGESNSNDDNEDGDEKPFAIKSQIEIQGMKPAERKKYYARLLAKTKERIELKESMKSKSDEFEGQASITSEPMLIVKSESIDSPLTEVRKPRTAPTFGIGRGIIPITSTRRMVGQQSDSEKPSMGSNIAVKRERSEGPNSIPEPKRRSPEIPF